jgi:hypothetical protein
MSISNLISKIWAKEGIKSVEDLSLVEKKEYERWQQIIEGSEITVDKLKDFCRSQVDLIEGKCDGVSPLTNIQQAGLHIYLNLLKLIESPEVERKNLEYYLTNLLNK